MEFIHELISTMSMLVPFTSATWFVIFIMVFIFFLFSHGSKRGGDCRRTIRWEDLIIDPELDKVSPYKVGYLIGVVVSTWIVISLSDGQRLTFDIMGLYLSYLLGGAGWSEFVNKRKPRGDHSEVDDYRPPSRHMPPLTPPPRSQDRDQF